MGCQLNKEPNSKQIENPDQGEEVAEDKQLDDANGEQTKNDPEQEQQQAGIDEKEIVKLKSEKLMSKVSDTKMIKGKQKINGDSYTNIDTSINCASTMLPNGSVNSATPLCSKCKCSIGPNGTSTVMVKSKRKKDKNKTVSTATATAAKKNNKKSKKINQNTASKVSKRNSKNNLKVKSKKNKSTRSKNINKKN